MKSISKNELANKLGSPNLTIVDVLPTTRPAEADKAYESYENIHINDSISIPRSDLEAGRWNELDKGKEIVVYCSSYSCSASRKAADFLESKGFNVRAYEGGLKEWAEAALPMGGKLTSEQYLAEKAREPEPIETAVS
jgi:rhodanese-related sulfurtransferase